MKVALFISQAPESMKTVLTSFWLLTVGIGNLIDIIVTGARLIDGQVSCKSKLGGLMNKKLNS